MFSPRQWLRIVFLLLLIVVGIAVQSSAPTYAVTEEEKLSVMRGQCEDRTIRLLQEERDIYRTVQFGGEKSVLSADTARTSDLVPYLVLNYQALGCRMEALCEAVALSHGHVGEGTVPPHRPLGCARLFAARGRWWSEERRPLGFNQETIPECAYREVAEGAPGFGVPQSYPEVELQCREWKKQILEEERQMLRLVVAQDGAERGTRKVVSVLQSVLRDVRDSFLEPLRGVVDLFGSVIHPIPCLLTQCN